jgi:hypothetical protein
MQLTKASLTAPAAVLLFFATLAPPSYAQQPPARDNSGFVLAGSALGSTSGGGLEVDARFRWASGVQLGLVLDGEAASHAYFGGTKAEGVASGAVKALALFPLLTARSVEFDLRVTTGLDYARDVSGRVTSYRDALRSVSELSWLAHVPLATASLFRAGAILTFEMETQPTQALADQALLLTVGFGHEVSESALFYANIDAGGTYGFDGDNGKVVTRGALGLRWSWDGAAVTAF